MSLECVMATLALPVPGMAARAFSTSSATATGKPLTGSCGCPKKSISSPLMKRVNVSLLVVLGVGVGVFSSLSLSSSSSLVSVLVLVLVSVLLL